LNNEGASALQGPFLLQSLQTIGGQTDSPMPCVFWFTFSGAGCRRFDWRRFVGFDVGLWLWRGLTQRCCLGKGGRRS
jgi:hypothetical protein